MIMPDTLLAQEQMGADDFRFYAPMHVASTLLQIKPGVEEVVWGRPPELSGSIREGEVPSRNEEDRAWWYEDRRVGWLRLTTLVSHEESFEFNKNKTIQRLV